MTDYQVYVRAQTADDRFAAVNAADLDERSFRLFVLDALVRGGLLTGLAEEHEPLFTPLTKEEAEKT